MLASRSSGFPGKGEDVEPEWFPIPRARIPPDIRDEDALQMRGRTVAAWDNRSQHVDTNVNKCREKGQGSDERQEKEGN